MPRRYSRSDKMLGRLRGFLDKSFWLAILLIASLVLGGCVVPSIGRFGRSSSGGQEYLKGAIVGDFPNLPLYPKARVIESYGADGLWGANFLVDEELAKVVNYYNDSLPKLGWETKLTKEAETNFLFEVKNAKQTGLVIVNTAHDGKKTAITVTVEPR